MNNVETTGAAQAGRHTPEPSKMALQLAAGSLVSQAIYVAARLGIADLLAEAPRSAEFLAVATSSKESSLYRLLRTLASVGVFTDTGDKVFANTPVSEVLRSDTPDSIKDLVLWLGDPEHWKVYGGLNESVRTGKPAWETVHGEPVFSYLFETNKELGGIFNRAMTSLSKQVIPAVLASYDLSGYGVIADIAGGHGHLLAAILQNNPQAKGILFDIRPVLDGAQKTVEEYGVSERMEFVSGDMMNEIPVEADAYILKHIIHDWPDETNKMILGNLRRSMPDGAKLLIMDTVIPEGNAPHPGKIIDMEMLVAPGGVERTAAEFEHLLAGSGFKLTRIINTASLISIIEAEKA